MNNFDLKAYLANNPLLTEAEDAEKVLASTPDEIEAALAAALKMSPEELEKKILSGKDGKEKLDESIAVTIALLLPAILNLVGKAANKIKQQFLPQEEKDELESMLQQIKDIRQKHDIGTYVDNPLNDTPEQKQAKGHIKKIKHEIEQKFGAKVPWLKWDKEKGFVLDKQTLGGIGHKLHHTYTLPIEKFLHLASFVPGAPKYIKDKKTRQKVADLIYAAFMLWLGGTHMKHGVMDILGGHGLNAVQVADTVANGYKSGLSFAEIAGEILNAAGVGVETGAELS
jgi:hypothetical protein